MALRLRLRWDQKALAHVWRRHRLELEDIRAAFLDPRARLVRGHSGRYIVVGRDRGGRLLSLIGAKVGGELRLKTARPANRREESLYR